MNRFVDLTAINLSAESEWMRNLRSGSATAFRDIDFSEDDLEREMPQAEEAPAPDVDVDVSNPPAGVYTPIMVFENDVREIYPRRGNRVGTRIVYRNGAARPVKESFAEVKAAFAALGRQVGEASD